MQEDRTAQMEVRLLGTFGARLDGAPLSGFRSAKARALLAYLAVESGRSHRRESLATLLWGEYPEHEALRSVSQALSNLRHLLAPLSSPGRPGAAGDGPVLVMAGQAVELRLLPDLVWVDVHAFDALLAAAGSRHALAMQAPHPSNLLARALALYRGPFLAGLSLPDCPEFEEWRLLHQEQRHQASQQALERLASHYLAEGRTDLVEQAARRSLALEPWNEGAYQSLMLALALDGQRAAALRQYGICRRVLAAELGVEPSAETEALRRQIRDGTWGDLAPPAHGTPEGAAGPPLTAFVARERETAHLDRLLGLALVGQGRAALVAGEAGSGKSALLRHFACHAVESHRSLVVAYGRCSAYARAGDPCLPFRELLQTLCGEVEGGWAGDGGNADNARRLWALFPRAAEALVEVSPDLVGSFVSGKGLATHAETVAPPGAAWPARLAELARSRAGAPAILGQEALFGQVTRLLRALARQQPLLLLVDDLQWADTASLSLLFHLGRRLAGSRMLVVGAYRPGEVVSSPVTTGEEGWASGILRPSPPLRQGGGGRHPLEALVHEFTRLWGDITVDLDRAGGRRFVDAFLDSEPNRLGERFRERLVGHTDGHALFTVELLRAYQERGELVRDENGCWVEGPAPHGEGLPPRVEAVIAERLARLPAAWRRVLEAAAVEGESFGAEVVAGALGIEPAWVRDLLSGPLSAESGPVQPLGVQRLLEEGEALSHYRFAHSLFQEYLYGHLDQVQRDRLHGEVGSALEGLCRGEEAALVQVSPQLARHYQAAQQPGKAAGFCLLAGRHATRLAGYEEAIALYRRGLALLAQTPDSRERERRQIELFLALDVPLLLARGWGAPERTQALQEAHRIALHLGESQPLMRVLLLLVDHDSWVGEAGLALEHSEELLRRAEQDHDPFYLAAGHLAAGLSHLHLGRLAASREHLEQALALEQPGSDPPRSAARAEQRPVRPPLLPVAGADLATASRAWLSVGLFVMGLGDQAEQHGRQALASVDDLDDPLTALLALVVSGAGLHAMRHEADAVQAHAGRMRELVERRGLAFTSGWAMFYLGCAQAQRGEREAGLAAMRAGLATIEKGGSLVFKPHMHCLLAEVLLQAGQFREGLEVLAAVAHHSERVLEAEISRLRGELLLARDGLAASGEALACFGRALEIAREQGALTWELRAAMSLVRLRQRLGEACAAELAEAHECLRGIYARFSEGFGFSDLQEAAALMRQ